MVEDSVQRLVALTVPVDRRRAALGVEGPQLHNLHWPVRVGSQPIRGKHLVTKRLNEATVVHVAGTLTTAHDHGSVAKQLNGLDYVGLLAALRDALPEAGELYGQPALIYVVANERQRAVIEAAIRPTGLGHKQHLYIEERARGHRRWQANSRRDDPICAITERQAG